MEQAYIVTLWLRNQARCDCGWAAPRRFLRSSAEYDSVCHFVHTAHQIVGLPNNNDMQYGNTALNPARGAECADAVNRHPDRAPPRSDAAAPQSYVVTGTRGYACCDCGWQGKPRRLRSSAVHDAVEHFADTHHQFMG